MRKMRLVGAATLLASVLAAGVSASASSASASGQSRVVRLAGLVSISSTGQSYAAAVVLPRPAVVREDVDTLIDRVHGRFAGFVLRKDGPGKQPSATVFRANGCLHVACSPRFDFGEYEWSVIAGDPDPADPTDTFRAQLPAGRYHLFVVADGAPVHATLRLHGLTGRVDVSSGAPWRIDIAQPSPSVFSPPAGSASPGQLYSAGSTNRGSTTGYVFFLHYKLVTGCCGAAQADVCGFEGPPQPNALGPYEYPCATPRDAYGVAWVATDTPWEVTGAEKEGGTGPAELVPRYVVPQWAFGLYDVPRGVASIGGYINTVTPAVESRTQTLWLDFTGAALHGKAWHTKGYPIG